MMEFLYEGLREGKRVKGRVEASDRREALTKLRSEGILPLEVEELRKGRAFWRREFYLGGPSEEDLSFVLLQLALLLESGIPLSKALELLATQSEDERISVALLEVKSGVERGEELSHAFRRCGVFPEFLPEMLAAAQTGENLERVFEIAGKHLETVAEVRSKVLSAITYPSIVVGFSLFALFVAVKFVVPRIARVLEGFGRELPLITKAVVLFSDLLTYALYLLPLFVLLFLYREKVFGRERLDRFFLRLPVVGRIGFYFNLSRFAFTLYMTLSSAVPITTAYGIAVRSLTNSYMRRVLEELSPEVERGKELSRIFKRSGIFPQLFTSLVETGESSGELERMLNLNAQIYRREALRLINLWVRMVEPVSLLFIGAVVGIMVLSVLLPLSEITSLKGKP